MIVSVLCMGYDVSMKYCLDCNKTLSDYRSFYCKSCSKLSGRNPMAGKSGEKHHRWKGGYINSRTGYKMVQHDGKKCYEHRIVMESILGRKLLRSEIVHHKNGDKLDNRPVNLELMSQADHVKHHKPMFEKKSKVKRDPVTQRFSK